MKKIHWMKKGKKYIAFALAFALLFGMAETPVRVQAASAQMEARFSEGFDAETAEWINEAGEQLTAIAQEREIMALVYLSDEYPVRVQPFYESQAAVNVPSGQLVFIEDVYVNLDEEENPEVWYYVSLFWGETEYTGYVPRYYLAVSDERFLSWEDSYGLNLQTATYAIDDAGKVTYPDIEQFPESYRPALTALKQKHPNWIFAVMNTGLDWNTVIANELTGGKSLVYYTTPAYVREGLYDDGKWYYASEAVLKQYMDPRNALTENAIFQFEQLTYNATYHTDAQTAVGSFLKDTFMNDNKPAPGTEKTYSQIFWEVGSKENVSPFHLASRVYQEQGREGTSGLISGTYPGYEGYYNYFNINASGQKTQTVIEKGLKHAMDKGWSNAYASILGGAQAISANYIQRGQDTLYLQKFNVTSTSTYTHQYMQNISAPTTEALSIKKLYEGAGALDNTFVFKIPVFLNMPATPCAAPTSSTNVVLSIPSGYKDTTVWLDGVPYTATKRNGQYIVQAPDTKAKTAVVYQYNDSGVPVGMYVWTLEYKNNAYAVTAQPELANLLTYHGFSIRITGKSGIRFKTGISADLRKRLTSTGVGGYTLKEYGTLIMNNANRGSYPMVLGGEKVLSGMAYGINASGAMEDKVYETVDGRYRYTSVLVGLPVDQYKTEYAFRGYAVLENSSGGRITVYGPVVAKSIYSLADQLLKGGSYAEGTEVYKFLKKLMSDADALQQ